jgi:hypothetical protein
MPPAVELCIESLRRHNPDFQLVDDAWMAAVAPDIVELVAGRSPQVRADLFRLWLLATHGGQWIDADCVALRRLDMAEHRNETVELVAFTNNNKQHVSNTVLAAIAGGELITEALRRAINVVKQRPAWQQIPYGATGQGVLGPLSRQFAARVMVCQRFRWAPLHFTDVRQFAIAKHDGGHAVSRYWFPNARAYHFTGKGLLHFGNLTRDQILTSPRFGSFLFRRSMGRVRPLRAREILKRVATERPVVGCEVGVHRAQNAAVLLQQRPQLELHLVDMWGANDSYRRSGDALAKRSAAQRARDYRHAQRAVAFAGDRALLRRAQSTDAAAAYLDGSLDFVFVDADHSYLGCRGDIEAWIPKIKPGGWIGGHDYGHRLERNGLWGVKRAVDEAAWRHRLTVETGSDLTWFCWRR